MERLAPACVTVPPNAANWSVLTCYEIVNYDWSSTLIQALDYYPYGSTRINQTTNNFNENKQFVGQYTDPETNLSYLQARYYDGSKGDFLSEDLVFLGDPKQQVLTDPQSLNSYSYGNDNPITKSDPTGRIAGADDLIAFGVGGVVNFSTYTITSAVTGQRMTPGGALGAFFTGGILGVGINNAPETGGGSVEAALLTIRAATKFGAAAGFAGEFTKQATDLATGNQGSADWGALAFSPVKGAFTNVLLEGALGNACVPGLSCGAGNMYSTGKALATKYANGSIGNISAASSFKSAVGAQVAGGYKTFVGTL